MDQLKEILRQAIIYRFWITVGLSALLPMVAYFIGVGPIKAQADTKTAAIKAADTGVKKYASGDIPNAQYKPLVAEKTEVLTKDVDLSWRKLYERQAALLTWPERVEARFNKWGRKWPENEDPGAIRFAVIDYINAYPEYVTNVYKSFKPFDPIEGTGVVQAPPEDLLLGPAKFSIESPPDLGKVWAAQERLWVQRTLLDVVAQVNKDAKDWDGAVLKQINLMEIGSAMAQDQRSIAKGDALDEAPEIVDPNKPAEEAVEEPVSAMAGMGGRRGMGGMGGPNGIGATATETVSYIHTDSTQFKVLPVELVVLMEQNRIQDLLVALANSPMSIQVMDFEMSKPETRVVKPEKGAAMNFGGMGGMGGMNGMMMRQMGGGGMVGFGGMGRGGMGEMGGMGGMNGMMMRQQMGGMSGMGGPAATSKKGLDKRSTNLAKKNEEAIDKAKKAKGTSLQDPYFNIVEVKVYGQARFFNPPPVETPAEPSTSEAPATPADAEKKADGEPAAEPKAEMPKVEAEPKAEGEPKAETPKVEAEPKAEAPAEPKAQGEPKAETPAPAEPKAEAEAPKADPGAGGAPAPVPAPTPGAKP